MSFMFTADLKEIRNIEHLSIGLTGKNKMKFEQVYKTLQKQGECFLSEQYVTEPVF